jgi:hypothetical protein
MPDKLVKHAKLLVKSTKFFGRSQIGSICWMCVCKTKIPEFFQTPTTQLEASLDRVRQGFFPMEIEFFLDLVDNVKLAALMK